VNAMFNCNFCWKLLQDPVILPCGKTICKSHTNENSSLNCTFCFESHSKPAKGFPANDLIQEMLKMELNTLNINVCKSEECRKSIHDLKAIFKEIEVMQTDPEYYISEHFDELNRQVDLRRETLIIEIQQCSNKIIEEIAKAKSECVALAKVKADMFKGNSVGDLDRFKVSLERISAKFDTFKIDDKIFENILLNSKLLKHKMDQFSDKRKDQLLGNNVYMLDTKEVKIDQVFGQLTKNSMNNQIFKTCHESANLKDFFQGLLNKDLPTGNSG
jgi:hypothetical protein